MPACSCRGFPHDNDSYIYIYKEDCLCLSVCLCPSVSMHSHSFQVTKFKLLKQVKDFQEQVVEGLTILRYPRELRNKGLITQKTFFSMYPHSFQDTELKFHRYVNDSTE